MGVHAVEEHPSDQRASDVSSRATHEHEGDVADVAVQVVGQVLEGRAQDRDTHALESSRDTVYVIQNPVYVIQNTAYIISEHVYVIQNTVYVIQNTRSTLFRTRSALFRTRSPLSP